MAKKKEQTNHVGQYSAADTQVLEGLEAELTDQADPRVLGFGDIFDSYPRFANMRPKLLPGFAERGRYNPEYAAKAQAEMQRLNLKP